MKFAGFETLLDAAIYRRNHGGWIFVTDFAEGIWFSPDFTPSQIMLHPVCKGKSGRLVCDNSILER